MASEQLKVSHLFLAFVPIALTPGLILVLAEGFIDLGGGEKDILAAFPYFVLTLIFFLSSTVLILKRWELRKWVSRAMFISLGSMAFLGIIAYITSWLGIA